MPRCDPAAVFSARRHRYLSRPLSVGLACALLGWAVAGCSPYPTRHSPTVRLHGPLHRAARRADVMGLTPGAAHSSGAPRMADLASAASALPTSAEAEDRRRDSRSMGSRAVDETLRAGESGASAASPDGASEPVSPIRWMWLDDQRRFAEAYRDELARPIADLRSTTDSTYVEPVTEARIRTLWVDEPFSIYNEQGRAFQDGFNVYLSDRANVRIWDHVLLSAEPELSFVERGRGRERAQHEDFMLRFQELSASGQLGPLEATVGRMPLWWGPGRHGALLVSNNASNFDLVRIGTSGPKILPGWLGYLGLIQVETFLTRLEHRRAVPDPYVWGMRGSTRILPWLELGASRVAQFGGKERSVTATTVRKVFLANSENDPDDPGNQIASIDGRIIVPWEIQPFELYTEFGGEDEAGGLFSKEAWLAGLYLPRIGPWTTVEFTLEVADTKVPGDQRVWYTNGNYPDGYTYNGEIIGHHAGTDALDIFTELRVHPCEDLEAFFSFDYEEHFRQDPVRERVFQVRIGAEARVWKRLSVHVVYGTDLWYDFRQKRGDHELGQAFGFGARWGF